MDTIRKAFSADLTALADQRQVIVTISSPEVDRAGDITIQAGIDISGFLQTGGTVLWQHNPDNPVARCLDLALSDQGSQATVQFPPEGVSPLADEIYGLIQARIVNSASIGFMPIESEPIDPKRPFGPQKYLKVELLEFSFVSVPAVRSATIVARSATATAPPKLKVKGLATVAWLAGLLSELGYLEDSVEWEAEAEGDDSPVPEMLAEALRQLGAALVAMTAEEVAELLGDESDDESAKAALRLRRKATAGLVKAGRVLSSANEDALSQARDLIEAVLAQLEPDEPDVSEDDPKEPGPADETGKSVAAIEILRRRAILARLKTAI